MTIRTRLLVAFLGLVTVCTGALAALAYHLSRQALRAEIESNLQIQAQTVVRHLDQLLAERVQNLVSWRRLDVMQELRVDDVDKRLSQFLRELKGAYRGIYRVLYCSREGRIVAASDAARIGARATPMADARRVHWYDTEVRFGDPRPGSGLALAVPLDDAYRSGRLGTLHAVLDWQRIADALDLGPGEHAIRAVLVDRDGGILAASAALRAAGWRAGGELPVLRDPAAQGTRLADLSPLPPGEVLLGIARSPRGGPLGVLGWRVALLVPVHEAYAPIRRQLAWLVAVMALTGAGGGFLAWRLSRQIARPIQDLTRYTRALPAARAVPPPWVERGDEVGELARAFAAMRDALEEYEAEVMRVGKLAAAGEMAANLAHEIRTPLGILRSSAQLLARRRDLDPRGREMVGYIIDECDRINRLVTRLLDAARPRAPALGDVDVEPVVQRAVELVREQAAQRQVSMHAQCDAGPLVVRADGEQLLQVVLNLVLNATQMVPVGGQVEVRAWREGERVVVAVEDDGPGVPEAERRRVLEPFVSHRRGGTGLGLAVVQQLVRLHRGTLSVGASRLGGASFVVRLPAAVEEEDR